MRALTYRELLNLLSEMPKDRLEDNVSVLINDEMLEIISIDITTQSQDVLDPGHYFLNILT